MQESLASGEWEELIDPIILKSQFFQIGESVYLCICVLRDPTILTHNSFEFEIVSTDTFFHGFVFVFVKCVKTNTKDTALIDPIILSHNSSKSERGR